MRGNVRHTLEKTKKKKKGMKINFVKLNLLRQTIFDCVLAYLFVVRSGILPLLAARLAKS